MRPDQANEPSNPPSPAAPATRPKLNLAKRTVADAPTSPAAGGDSKASPFGAARPIDTATREREVEQKRQLALRQKKENDEKIKAEKAEKAKQKTPGTDSNKDGVDTPQGAKNFEILRRAGGDESGMVADEETAEETPAAATPAAEEAQKEPANGNWRAADAPAPTEDNDGWSTVGTKPRNNRRGQAGRA
jgi:translation initiation factor 4B